MPSIFNDRDVQEALSLIENSKLPHPSGPLLSSFIFEALNPRLAAQYILQTCLSDRTRKADLLSLASDWTYLVESSLPPKSHSLAFWKLIYSQVSPHGCFPKTPDKITQAAIVKRDGAKCCITGRTSSYGDPLVVVPIIPIPSRWIEVEVCQGARDNRTQQTTDLPS
jgi:hypothetical protein